MIDYLISIVLDAADELLVLDRVSLSHFVQLRLHLLLVLGPDLDDLLDELAVPGAVKVCSVKLLNMNLGLPDRVVGKVSPVILLVEKMKILNSHWLKNEEYLKTASDGAGLLQLLLVLLIASLKVDILTLQ